MGYTLCDKLSSLIPYEPIRGEYEIRLDANESFINISDTLLEEYSRCLKDISINRYPDPYSLGAIKAFSDFYGIDENLVTAGNGSDELISIISSTFLKKNSKVVTLTPDFTMYSFYSSLYENKVLNLKKDKDTLNINCNAVIDFVNSNKADMLIFSNPCNPTSQGLSREDVLFIVKNVSCLVVVDEAYMDFWDQSVLGDVASLNNLMVLKTCSKAIGLAGVRFGFAVSSKLNTNALHAAKSPYNTDSISQKIVETTFLHKDLLNSNIELIVKNTKDLYQFILPCEEKYDIIKKVYKPYTNFVFIKTDKAREINTLLLKKLIAVRCFDSYLRVTAGSESENERFISAFNDVLSSLEKE